MFTDYRAFSRRFVKSFPAVSSGFEVETEISVHASQLHLPVAEIPVDYGTRPEGSVSKLRTFTDGAKILKAMVVLLRENHPLLLFGWLAAACYASAGALGIPLAVTFAQTGLVPRLPAAVLATGPTLLGLLLTVTGLILDSIAKSGIEVKRLAYLNSPPAGRVPTP